LLFAVTEQAERAFNLGLAAVLGDVTWTIRENHITGHMRLPFVPANVNE
jgi:hypothetical protein